MSFQLQYWFDVVFGQKRMHCEDLKKSRKDVTYALCQPKIFIFLAAMLLLFTANCTSVGQFVESSKPYHTETYKSVSDKWSREARIYRGFEVKLIVSATFKSHEFRRAYADEYAEAHKLTSQEKKHFMEDQLNAATLGHEFLMASFVPEKKWDDFDKFKSMWSLYLVNDKDERVAPIEVRRVKRHNAVTPHFYPYITPWKSIYTVRFPYDIPEGDRPFIGDKTKEVKLVITSVLGTAEMQWKLE